MTPGKPSRLFWRESLTIRKNEVACPTGLRSERISVFDRKTENWVPTQTPSLSCQNNLVKAADRSTERAHRLRKLQNSQLSLLIYRRTLRKILSYVKLYWDYRWNKFSLDLYPVGRGPPSLILKELFRHFETRGFPRNFPWNLVWAEDPPKPNEDMDCKDASPEPRSISPDLKRVWKRIVDIWICAHPLATFRKTETSDSTYAPIRSRWLMISTEQFE